MPRMRPQSRQPQRASLAVVPDKTPSSWDGDTPDEAEALKTLLENGWEHSVRSEHAIIDPDDPDLIARFDASLSTWKLANMGAAIDVTFKVPIEQMEAMVPLREGLHKLLTISVRRRAPIIRPWDEEQEESD